MARMGDADYRAVIDSLHDLCKFVADKDDHPGWLSRAILATALTGILEVTEANATHVLQRADWPSVLHFFTAKGKR